jgi:signal transduction histidine kinase
VQHAADGADYEVTVTIHDDRCIIDVVDEGVGVPVELDVFAPFQRGSSTTEGAGLGLYIVRNLVRAMGGDVTASRNPSGVGSTFSVRLPDAR